MAIALVGERFNSDGTNPGSTSAATFSPSAATVIGNLLILIFGGSSGTTITSVSDSQGNTWYSPAGLAQNSGSTNGLSFAYTFLDVAALSTSDTITVNYGGGPGHRLLLLEEFSGVADVATTHDDGEAKAASGTVSLTPGNAGDLVILSSLGTGTTWTAGTVGGSAPDGSGLLSDSVTSGKRTMGWEYLLSAGSGALSCTSTPRTTPAGVAVAFKAASGGASPQTLDAGKVASPEAVRGADLTPGTATLDAGKVASGEAARGADLTAGTAALDAGKVQSAEAVHGADLTPGTVTLDAAKVASPELVRGADVSTGAAGQTIDAGKVASSELVNGADLTPGTATLSAGTVTSSELVHGVTLTPGTTTLAAGKIAGTSVVRGADVSQGSPAQTLSAGRVTSSAAVLGVILTPGTTTLSPGRIASTEAVRGVTLTPGAVTLTSGRIGSVSTVRGAALSYVSPTVLGTVALADSATAAVALTDVANDVALTDMATGSVALSERPL